MSTSAKARFAAGRQRLGGPYGQNVITSNQESPTIIRKVRECAKCRLEIKNEYARARALNIKRIQAGHPAQPVPEPDYSRAMTIGLTFPQATFCLKHQSAEDIKEFRKLRRQGPQYALATA